nr:MAG TPA: hypothetical protein [Caudoviricetes sp.]
MFHKSDIHLDPELVMLVLLALAAFVADLLCVYAMILT